MMTLTFESLKPVYQVTLSRTPDHEEVHCIIYRGNRALTVVRETSEAAALKQARENVRQARRGFTW